MQILVSVWLSMTISGSIGFLVYLFLRKIHLKSVSASCLYTIWKVCLFFYLAPLPLIRIPLEVLKKPENKMSGQLYVREAANSVSITSNGIQIPPFPLPARILLFCLMAGITALFLHRYLIYEKFCRIIISGSVEIEHSGMLSGTVFCVPEHIRLLYSFSDISPFSFGIRRPVIVLTKAITPAQTVYAAEHELEHIRNKDLLFRILGLFCVCIHFLNPFIYLFHQEMYRIQELVCDEHICRNLSPKERADYGKMLLEVTVKARSQKSCAVTLTNGRNRILQERIIKIASMQKTPGKGSGFWIGCAAFLCFLPCLVYQPPVTDFRTNGLSLEVFNTFPEEAEFAQNVYEMTEEEDELFFQGTEEYVILEDGSILTNLYTVPPDETCRHIFRKGMCRRHNPLGKACIVDSYPAKICTRCGCCILQARNASFTYRKCPHHP